MTTLDAILKLARLQDPDIGDSPGIAEGEWHFCVGAYTFVSKKAVQREIAKILLKEQARKQQ